jgi:AhpD family alkylhydroperoxidase
MAANSGWCAGAPVTRIVLSGEMQSSTASASPPLKPPMKRPSPCWLDAKLRERIALAVAEYNGCDYCLSAHNYLGRNVAKTDIDFPQVSAKSVA